MSGITERELGHGNTGKWRATHPHASHSSINNDERFLIIIPHAGEWTYADTLASGNARVIGLCLRLRCSPGIEAGFWLASLLSLPS